MFARTSVKGFVSAVAEVADVRANKCPATRPYFQCREYGAGTDTVRTKTGSGSNRHRDGLIWCMNSRETARFLPKGGVLFRRFGQAGWTVVEESTRRNAVFFRKTKVALDVLRDGTPVERRGFRSAGGDEEFQELEGFVDGVDGLRVQGNGLDFPVEIDVYPAGDEGLVRNRGGKGLLLVQQ